MLFSLCHSVSLLVPLKCLTDLYSYSIQPLSSPKRTFIDHSTSNCWLTLSTRQRAGQAHPQLPFQPSSVWGVLRGTVLPGPGGTQGPVTQGMGRTSLTFIFLDTVLSTIATYIYITLTFYTSLSCPFTHLILKQPCEVMAPGFADEESEVQKGMLPLPLHP